MYNTVRSSYPSSPVAYTAWFEGCERIPREKSISFFFCLTEACFLTKESNEFDRRFFATLKLNRDREASVGGELQGHRTGWARSGRSIAIDAKGRV